MSDGMHLSIENHRVIVNAIEISLQTLITTVVIVLQPLQDSLQANTYRYLMPIKRIYLKVYIVSKDAERRLFFSPILHIGDQSLYIFLFDAGSLRWLFDLLTCSPYVDPSLDLFGVSS